MRIDLGWRFAIVNTVYLFSKTLSIIRLSDDSLLNSFADLSAFKVRFKFIQSMSSIMRDIAEKNSIRFVIDSLLIVSRDSRRRVLCLSSTSTRIQRNVLSSRNVQLTFAKQTTICDDDVLEVQCAFLVFNLEKVFELLIDDHHYQIHLSSFRCLYSSSKSVIDDWEFSFEKNMSQSAESCREFIAALRRIVLLRKIRENNWRARDLLTSSRQSYDRELDVSADIIFSDYLTSRNESTIHALICRSSMRII